MPWEVRFFYDNMDDYEKVTKWFKSIDDEFETEERNDMYFFLPESSDLGIKIRQGRDIDGNSKPAKLEIKWRRKKDVNITLLDGKVNGILEDWIKWSWNSGPVESNDHMVDFFSVVPGITIGKERSLRRYVYDNNFLRSTKWIKEGDDGLSCEITKITSRNTNWWSIGFEGFGTKNNEQRFCYFLENTLKDFPIRLQKNSSFGYPEWISRHFT